jgi:hypothetical protein
MQLVRGRTLNKILARQHRFGRIIHEFDPWFNMRATTYLARNGLQKFFTWFDHESWYPIGRPVGTTIYPGLQIVAVALWRTLKRFGYVRAERKNDVCPPDTSRTAASTCRSMTCASSSPPGLVQWPRWCLGC